MSYKPIEDYGVIGDLHSVALVGKDGSIDWCCLPNFDSPSVFAAILDDKKGGFFKVGGVGDQIERQLYHPDTNVLMTYFSDSGGVALLEDFMPMDGAPGRNGGGRRPLIVRRLTGVRGTKRMRLECLPGFDYARASHRVNRIPDGVLFESDRGERMALSVQGGGHAIDLVDGRAFCEFDLGAGESVCIALCLLDKDDSAPLVVTQDDAQRMLNETIAYWRRWLSRCTYKGRWREMVYRSVLTLKLLTFAPTGAIVAAPTCSLPELIGGSRNWDYRYTWMRDAAFTVYGFMRVGLTEEAGHFMEWLEARTAELSDAGTPEIMYRLDGGHDIEEQTLGHLDGYRGSKPVRVGNNAKHQLQLDIFGELMDSVYLYNKYGSPISSRPVDAAPTARRLGRRQLAAGRRGDLGGARRQAAVRLLQVDVLGRVGQGTAPRRQALVPGAQGPVAQRQGHHIRDDHGPRMERRAAGLRPVLRLRRPGCVEPADAPGLLHLAARPADALDH